MASVAAGGSRSRKRVEVVASGLQPVAAGGRSAPADCGILSRSSIELTDEAMDFLVARSEQHLYLSLLDPDLDWSESERSKV
jgi:hypothetical protein